MLESLVPLIARGVNAPSATDALVSLLESYVEQGIVEQGQNAGPMVEFFQVDGGGSGTPVAWCAYFVSSCLRTLARCGFKVDSPGASGRAVSFWQRARDDQRGEREDVFNLDDPRGRIFVRTRTSKPVSDRERARDGKKTAGHTGFITHISEDPDTGEPLIYCVAGNSTGSGHASGTGGVCVEVISKGSLAWDRLVGFVRVT